MSKNNSTKLSANRAIEMYAEQKGKCIYCGHTMMPGDIQRKPTLEHILPRSLGGKSNPDNLALACFKCNSWRGNIDQELFLDGYRTWCEHSGDSTTNSTIVPRKVRGPKRWYHGNWIVW